VTRIDCVRYRRIDCVRYRSVETFLGQAMFDPK